MRCPKPQKSVVSAQEPAGPLPEPMATDRKPWRDIYCFFKEMFETPAPTSAAVVYHQECAISAYELNVYFLHRAWNTYHEKELDQLLAKYFERLDTGAEKYLVKRSNYFLLLHEIHDPALPADLLPFNYMGKGQARRKGPALKNSKFKTLT